MYIKCRFIKADKPCGRAYTYCAEDDLSPGDIVTDARGSKLIVTDEPVDMGWVDAYGAEKIGIVKKYTEAE